MNDYVKIKDSEGVEHIVNKRLVSEISDGKDGCILYVCGHPIKTRMTWNEMLHHLKPSTTETNLSMFLRKGQSSCSNQ